MASTHERAPDPRPARTRAAIFAAARELTAEDGEVTVNALAKRAGVSRAAFYSHFAGLDSLMGAMLQQMFENAWARGGEYTRQDRTVHQGICFGFGMLAAYVERHHAFLHGALEWKFSHLTYMSVVDTMVELHGSAMGFLGDEVPEHLRTLACRRAIVGGCLALVTQWLAVTTPSSGNGEGPDATELLDQILTTAPAWYTGIAPGQPTGAGELLEICRQAQEDPAAD